MREDDELIDHARVRLFEVVCNSGRWVDDFFGEASYRRHAQNTHGRFGLRMLGDESDGVDGKLTFRANVELPNFERRLNIFLGREHEDRIFDGFDTDFPLFPELRHSESERQWLLGASYDLLGGASKGLDVDTGVEVRTPLEPYVRTSYRYYWLLADNYLVRSRQSVFWQNQRGFGATTSVDLERDFGDQHLLRFSNRVSVDETTEGAAWRSSVTFFHTISEDRALAYLIGIDGATDSPVPVHQPGVRVTYRQRMLRQWFFGEVVGGVAWRRDAPGLPRDESYYVGVGFEMVFGFDRRRQRGAVSR